LEEVDRQIVESKILEYAIKSYTLKSLIELDSSGN